jgi:hypothetical protein
MNKKRELQFLTYLNALEEGDAKGLSAFLALAEADAELEKMMMDYHQEENADSSQEKSKVMIPLKRKREDVNRWWRRFGSGIIAAILMVIVGTAGIFIGSGIPNDADSLRQSLNPTNDPNALTTPNSPAAWNVFCEAVIVNEDNTIHLLPSEDIDREMTVGVNNPFALMLNDGRASEGYNAIFEGLSVVIDKDSISLDSRCERLRSIQVLPGDDAYKSCDIDIDPVIFPFRDYQDNLKTLSLTDWLILAAPVAEAYPVDSLVFAGHLPIEAVHLSRGCTSYPLLYVPRLQRRDPVNTIMYPDGPVVDIEHLRVTEQRFEHGIFFYVEPVEQLWIVFDHEDQRDTWYVSGVTEPWDTGNLTLEAPDGLFPPQAGLFELVWTATGFEPEGVVREQIGWALSEPVSYEASYDYRLLAQNHRVHILESSTGDRYSLYERENLWRLNED